ncbi:hypothetical protein Poli38472_012978 [Pythium oligandrum]|uniref:Uncharacterized protein n=1 Tax=Pythium oligandrum TaxID=41045 RepID=A0A8K1CIS5_PYTOL|nr:hypothetical protein Poli38472_012978 [Pythium oligandrum]|eukprot:TMW64356.1 hypothetical protein Poli38472_012978 [Pythium oligandrum]
MKLHVVLALVACLSTAVFADEYDWTGPSATPVPAPTPEVTWPMFPEPLVTPPPEPEPEAPAPYNDDDAKPSADATTRPPPTTQRSKYDDSQKMTRMGKPIDD